MCRRLHLERLAQLAFEVLRIFLLFKVVRKGTWAIVNENKPLMRAALYVIRLLIREVIDGDKCLLPFK